MDWSRSKTIFIGVFLILNIFLYSQFNARYEEGQNVEMPGDQSIEAKLKNDNITYVELPTDVESASFISGKVRNFSETPLIENPNIYTVVKDNHILNTTLREPYKLEGITKENLEQFVKSNIPEGKHYTFWSIDEEARSALFFQLVNKRTLFYNDKGYIKIYWDDEGRIYAYEQAILEQLEEYDQKESIMTPIQAIQILYSRSLLTSDSKVTKIELGYSTLVQLIQTQVFVPTWEVEIEKEDKSVEIYYVNAADGKIIDIDANPDEVEQEE